VVWIQISLSAIVIHKCLLSPTVKYQGTCIYKNQW